MVPRAVAGVTARSARAAAEAAVTNRHPHRPAPGGGKRPGAEQRNGPGAAVLLVALPLLCCGAPAIVAALSAAGAATLGTVGALAGAGLVAVAARLRLRRRQRPPACCAPTEWRS